jgi:NADH-quinone oxidoreductase subunit A
MELSQYLPIILLMAFAVGLILVSLLIGKFIRTQSPSDLKLTAYECGELPEGTAWSHFHARFYVVGLIFIIFDVESVLMFPVAAVFKRFHEIGRSGLVLIEVLLFILVLVSGLSYCWRRGDLDWVKSFVQPQKPSSNIHPEESHEKGR